ncbi:hypothetical protein AVEN_29649-1 [Araneus ventricosus]|uniref:Uncharacterized protein n=1 Tax=Araneus ventricosus TaxID=182803 RepID=A0A4Y2IWC6_ARAVE|nr:hypothetical protein AVEN_271563-1 [Araneus ventricosus]GBM81543.1 hypothetical protein AVEN_29649-1 [Araneus ventricosus]
MFVTRGIKKRKINDTAAVPAGSSRHHPQGSITLITKVYPSVVPTRRKVHLCGTEVCVYLFKGGNPSPTVAVVTTPLETSVFMEYYALFFFSCCKGSHHTSAAVATFHIEKIPHIEISLI